MKTQQPQKNRPCGRISRTLLAAIALIGLLTQFAAPSAFAVTYYWDNDGATAGFGTASGTWAVPTTGNSSQGWSTNGTGGTLLFNVTTTTGDAVNFGNGATGLGAGTITVSGSVSNGSMTFASGSGAIVLSGGTNVFSAGPTIAVNSSTHTINNVLSGAGTSFIVGGSGTLVLNGTNTFAGRVSIGNNTSAALKLQVNNIQNLGVASSLGTPVTAANGVIQIGVSSFASTLEFTGASANCSTDRKVQIGSALNGSGSSTILNNDPTYTLTFSNPYFNQVAQGSLSSSVRSLTLGGTNTGNNEIQGVITNNLFNSGLPSNVGLVKSGSGTWVLSGVNTYTGGTTINDGTLKLTGSGAIVSATINVAGATGIFDVSAISFTLGGSQTLRGSGTVTGEVTVASGGTLTGGSSVSNTLTFTTNVTFSGTGTVNVSTGAGGSLLNYTNVAAINVGGVLTCSGGDGSNTLNLSTAAVVPGVYHLIQFGSGSLTTNPFVLGTVPAPNPRQTGVLQVNGNYLDYVVTGSSPSWTGLQSSEWSTNTIAGSKNWTVTAGPTDYIEGDAVLFDDTAAGTRIVDISVAAVVPSSVIINSTNDYTLQGSQGISGTTVLTKPGSGSLTISNANTYTGATTISGGTLNLAGSLNDSAVTVNGTGLLLQSAGSVIAGTKALTVSTAGKTNVLRGANTYSGTTTVSSGTLQLGDGTAGNDGSISNSLSVVVSGSGALIYDLFGNVTYGGNIGTTGSGPVTKRGPGTLAFTGASTYQGFTYVSGGTLDLTGGRIYANSAGQVTLMTVNNGATLKVASFGQSQTTASLGNLNPDAARLMVDGGTIQINSSGTHPRSLTVGANGATLESASGVDYVQSTGNTNNYITGATLTLTGAGNGTISNSVSGTGVSIVKSGAGTWTLAGANTHTGNTTVSNGTLRVNGSSLSTTTVKSGATLGGSGSVNAAVTVESGGAVTAGNGTSGTLTVSNLTFNGTGTVNVGTLTGYSSVAAINVTNAITLSGGAGAVTINLPTASVPSGTYRLLQFGSGTVTTSLFTLGTVPVLAAHQTSGTLQVNGNYLDYVVSGEVIWTGAQTTEWSVTTAVTNWTFNGNPDVYLEGDSVLFNNTATTKTVDISVADVLPTTVLFTNTTGNDYTVQGTFGIAGTTSLTKRGNGLVTLNNVNTFTGGTTISAGTLALGNATDSLAGAVTVDGATAILSVGANSDSVGVVSLKNGAAITGSGGTLTGSSYAMESGSVSAILGGTAAATKTTTNTVTLSGANTYTGTTTVSAGTLAINNRDAVSTMGTLHVTGTSAGNLATVGIGGGTLNFAAGRINLAGQGGGVGDGTINQTGGTVLFTGGDMVVIAGGAPAAGATGTYNLSGGSIDATGSAGGIANRGVLIAANHLGTGILNLSGTGSLLLGTNMVQVARGDGSATGLITMSGTFNQTGGTAQMGFLSIGGNSIAANKTTNVQAYVNLTGGTFVATNFLRLANGGGDTNAVLIGGTADVTLPAFPLARGPGSINTLTLDGGTLRPLAASASYLQAGIFDNAYLTTNGAHVAVASGKDITVAHVLQNAASQAGKLTKSDAGVLTLTGANSYTGNTTVNGGTLAIAVASIATNSTVSVAAGAVLQLDFATTNIVAGFVTNGVSLPAGVYSAGNVAPFIANTGSLEIVSAGPVYPPATLLTNSVSGSTLSLSWPGGQGWRLQEQTNSRSVGLRTNWVFVTDASVNSTNITVDKTMPTTFFRLVYP